MWKYHVENHEDLKTERQWEKLGYAINDGEKGTEYVIDFGARHIYFEPKQVHPMSEKEKKELRDKRNELRRWKRKIEKLVPTYCAFYNYRDDEVHYLLVENWYHNIYLPMLDKINNEVKPLIKKALKEKAIPCVNPSKTIVIDCETTGLGSYDEILQLSIVDGDNNVLLNEYVKPYLYVQWPRAEKINHISPQMVENAPSLHELIPKIKGIFASCDTIVGYNTYFDLRFLTFIERENKEIIDVMEIFAPIYGEWSDKYGDFKWQKLITCAEYYGFDWNSIEEDAHNSLGDCKATLHCYKAMHGDAKNDKNKMINSFQKEMSLF